jgi:serine/threonine protein kinase
MPSKITSFRTKLLIPFLVLQFVLCAVFLISYVRNSRVPSVAYSSSLGEGASAKAYPAIIKVGKGKFDLRVWWRDEATILEKVKGKYVVKLYGHYKDRRGSDVIVLEKIDGRPIFRPADVFTASFAIKMRVLREMLYALRHIHQKGILSVN